MNLAYSAETIHRRIIIHIEKAKSIQQQTPEIENLTDDLTKSKEITEKVIKEIEELEIVDPEKVKKLEEKVKKLEEKITSQEEDEEYNQNQFAHLKKEILKQDEQIAHLNEKVDRHEMKFKNLEIGQIPFDFEKDLATYIYPHDKKFGSRKIFTEMKRWLEEKKDTSQGREANEKWRALQNEFSWSPEHERVFFKLLEFRKQVAHPTVDRDKVQSQISDDFTDEEKVLVKDIIKMTDRVNELMR